MKDFVLIFRNSDNPNAKPSPEQMQQVMINWMNWMGSIAAQNKLADKGNRLSMSNSKTVKPNAVVTDGPYTPTDKAKAMKHFQFAFDQSKSKAEKLQLQKHLSKLKK